MSPNATPMDQVLDALDASKRICCMAHFNPDGDALGSTAAMGYLARCLGKEVVLYNCSGVPDHFAWLRLPAELHARLDTLPFEPDTFVVMDCGDAERMGDEAFTRIPREKIVQLDHHLGNPLFGRVNWVDTSYAAVCQMVAHLCRAKGVGLSGPLGEAIYLGMFTDTGSFSYGNTNPDVLETAAEIVRLGLDPGTFSGKLENQWPFSRLKLWARIFENTTLHLDGQVGVMRVNQADLSETGTSVHDTEGLVNLLRKVDTVRFAVILREDEPGNIKFSIRSVGKDNAQYVASLFGGGGHKNAAGGRIMNGMDKAERALLGALAEALADGENV